MATFQSYLCNVSYFTDWKLIKFVENHPNPIVPFDNFLTENLNDKINHRTIEYILIRMQYSNKCYA